MSDTNELRRQAALLEGAGLLDTADAIEEAAAETERPRARYVPCLICRRPVDTWEETEGGGPHGCQHGSSWVCSHHCYNVACAARQGASDE